MMVMTTMGRPAAAAVVAAAAAALSSCSLPSLPPSLPPVVPDTTTAPHRPPQAAPRARPDSSALASQCAPCQLERPGMLSYDVWRCPMIPSRLVNTAGTPNFNFLLDTWVGDLSGLSVSLSYLSRRNGVSSFQHVSSLNVPWTTERRSVL